MTASSLTEYRTLPAIEELTYMPVRNTLNKFRRISLKLKPVMAPFLFLDRDPSWMANQLL
ncbi:hypothetical protein EJ377_17470 [Chryseobacterium arthrosphaerae]|uniref:Uncharacterized protein n=1 Tax=Chryseobacterium arthrosphaerae TaxID=651561 RepID=A0A432DSV3_9FLAO|nr:hypothetical protein EJ377_17470 [Chryseobacterium arthrosphaerae]